jgi:serine/threonine protein kinase
MSLRPTHDFLQTIDNGHWWLGDQHLLSRTTNPCEGAWSDGEGSFYHITAATKVAQSWKPQTHFPIVHEAGLNSSHVIWKIGDAFLKLVIPHSPMITQEHDTLNAIKTILPNGITIPQVLLHGEWGGRYFLILKKVPGLTLHEAWPHMSSDLKSQCVQRVTELCLNLARTTGQKMSGIDGGHLPEFYLLNDGKDTNFSPSKLEENSREIGMDCSTLCFYHCDLGPGNVLVDLNTKEISVIDWECAGYVPQAWIRTKFLVCSSMNLEIPTDSAEPRSREEWRHSMQMSLGKRGFADLSKSWRTWMFPAE